MAKKDNKQFKTYKTHYESDASTFDELNAMMQCFLSYKTHRFAALRHETIEKADMQKADAYRKTQTFINEKGQEKETFDACYSRTIEKSIVAFLSSRKECQNDEIFQKEGKLERIQYKYHKAKDKYQNYKQHSAQDWQGVSDRKKSMDSIHRKIQQIKAKIASLQTIIDNGSKDHIVFGSTELWKKYNQIIHNPEATKEQIETIKQQWSMRGSEIECYGTKGEEYGNKNIRLMKCHDVDYDKLIKRNKQVRKKHKVAYPFDVSIKVPPVLQSTYGETIVLEKVNFYYGKEEILANIEACEHFQTALKAHNNETRRINKRIKTLNEQLKDTNNPDDINTIKKAIKTLEKSRPIKPLADSYGCKAFAILIKKDVNDRLSVHVSIEQIKHDIITHDKKGVIGIDINYDNIAMAEINQVGQLINSEVFRYNFGAKHSSSHREQQIFIAVNEIIKYATKIKKDIVIEDLNFIKTKIQQDKGINPKNNYKTHSFPYAKVINKFLTEGFLNGVNVHQKNPAYSSLIGKICYTKAYGISTHQAAAYVMARRYYGLKEKIPFRLIFNHRGVSCSVPLPEDEVYTHVSKKKTNHYIVNNELNISSLYQWFKKIVLAYQQFPLRKTDRPSRSLSSSPTIA